MPPTPPDPDFRDKQKASLCSKNECIMAKKSAFPSVFEVQKAIKNGDLQPVYFLFGESEYLLKKTMETLEAAAAPLLSSDFDKKIFYGADSSFDEISDFALSFPFGSEKKLLIVKEFEKLVKSEKAGLNKKLPKLVDDPPDFSIILFIYNGELTGFSDAYLKALKSGGYIYEARELSQAGLATWLIEYAEQSGKKLSKSNAELLITIIGEDRYSLEGQLEKMITFTGDSGEVTQEIIADQAISSKEYKPWDLNNMIAEGKEAEAFTIALKLFEKNGEILSTVATLNKYFIQLAEINEMLQKRVADDIAARKLRIHPFIYKKFYRTAAHRYPPKRLYRVFNALLEADLSVKTSRSDPETILTLLLREIFRR